MTRRSSGTRRLKTALRAAGLAAPAALLSYGLAAAQPAEPDAAPPQDTPASKGADAKSGLKIEQVMVTARKRVESEQTVPIAMTAISAELQAASVRDIKDLVAFTPNVRLESNPQRGNAANFTIRGISPTRTDDNSLDSPIGVLIDGVYIGSLPGQVVDNFDLERVEILRGPQGTLFGRNTVGGAVSVFRTEPTGEWGANVQYTTGSWNDQEFRGVFNIPVVEGKLAAKAFVAIEHRDGYLHNTFLNINQPQKDYKNYGITLKATPNDWFTATLTAEKYDDRSQGGAFLGNYNVAPGVLPVPTNPNDINAHGGLLAQNAFLAGLFGFQVAPSRTSLEIPKTINGNNPNPGKVETEAYTLNMKATLSDNLSLVSVTGYRKQHEQTSFDFDGSSANFINIGTNAHYHQFSEELRAEGSWDSSIGKISMVTGAYYWSSHFDRGWATTGDFWNVVNASSGYKLTSNQWLSPALQAAAGGLSPIDACLAPRTPTLFAIFGRLACDPGATTSNGYAAGYTSGEFQKLFEEQSTNSVAFFSHADWEFYPSFTLTAGLRWTYEKKHFTGYQGYVGPSDRIDVFAFPTDPAPADLQNSWRQLTPTVSLSYQITPDIMAYASFSEGWHSGGYFGVNQNVADFTRDQYAPEKSKSYEIGVKSQLFDNSVQLNVAAFRSDFTNKQESAVQLDPTTNTVVTVFTNVGGARYQGIEADLQWLVTENLNLSGSIGYLDAKYTNLDIVYPNNPSGVQTDAAKFLVPRNAPKITAGGQATYTVPVGPGDLALSSRISYVSNLFGGNISGLYNESYSLVKAHVDVSASLSYSWDKYTVTVFGRNLTNHIYEVPSYIATLFASSTINPGRSWGVEVGAKF